MNRWVLQTLKKSVFPLEDSGLDMRTLVLLSASQRGLHGAREAWLSRTTPLVQGQVTVSQRLLQYPGSAASEDYSLRTATFQPLLTAAWSADIALEDYSHAQRPDCQQRLFLMLGAATPQRWSL